MSKKRKKILIVDDEEDIRELLIATIASSFQCDILEANCGDMANSLIDQHPDLSLIMSDFRMPNGTGEDVYRHVREKKLAIPFFLITGFAFPTDSPLFANFEQMGLHNKFIQKPFSQEELLKELARIL